MTDGLTYTIRLTQQEWSAIEAYLSQGQLANPHVGSALTKIAVANTALQSMRTEASGHSNGGSIPAVPAAEALFGEVRMRSEVRAMSRRETLILKALSRGASNKEIARTLVITESTVKVHMKAILRKLRLKNRTQAAVWVKDNGFDIDIEQQSQSGAIQRGEPGRPHRAE